MRVFNKEETKKIIETALDTAYQSVAHTLGPRGSNVVTIIDGKSTVTNDGVSIIKQLRMDNEYNIPLDIIKDACFSAENKSGDGTTTAIVLTKAIYENASKLAKDKNLNEMFIRNKILDYYPKIEKLILDQKTEIKSIEDIKGVATVSLGGNEHIADKIAKAFELVNLEGNIEFKIDDTSEDISIEKLEGYVVDSEYLGYVNNYFGEFDNALIIVYTGSINTANDIKSLAMAMRGEHNKRPVVIFSNFSSEALNTIYQYNNVGTRIIPYSLPNFGVDRESTIMELMYLTNGSIIDKNTPFDEIDFEENGLDTVCGSAKCILKSKNILLTSLDEERFNKVLSSLKEKNPKRYNQIKNGLCNILIGGKTLTEAEETLMRVEDAVNSVRLALKSGIAIGGANLMYKISNHLDDKSNDDDIEKIFIEALKQPLKQIMINDGTINECEEELSLLTIGNNYGFDSSQANFTDLMESKIIDPAETIVNSVKSAVSIATSLITINCIINNK